MIRTGNEHRARSAMPSRVDSDALNMHPKPPEGQGQWTNVTDSDRETQN